jgi:hypothetical protein
MTRTISLVAAMLAGLALAPAAAGNHQFGDAFVRGAQPDVFERAARVQRPDFWNYDGRTGAPIANTSPDVRPQELARLYLPDVKRPESMLVVKERALDARLARAARSATPVAVGEGTTDAGGPVEWLELGIGFGAGIVLAFGLFLGLRLVRVRRPAY